jgi:hypothetical protein
MNRDDIIRMAREVKGASRSSVSDGSLWLLSESHLEAFAALIEQHMSYDSTHTCHDECQRPACVAVREAVKAEREVCADMVESMNVQHPKYIAAAIRARCEK